MNTATDVGFVRSRPWEPPCTPCWCQEDVRFQDDGPLTRWTPLRVVAGVPRPDPLVGEILLPSVTPTAKPKRCRESTDHAAQLGQFACRLRLPVGAIVVGMDKARALALVLRLTAVAFIVDVSRRCSGTRHTRPTPRSSSTACSLGATSATPGTDAGGGLLVCRSASGSQRVHRSSTRLFIDCTITANLAHAAVMAVQASRTRASTRACGAMW